MSLTPEHTRIMEDEDETLAPPFVERRGWRFDRSVNLPTVLTAIGLIIAALSYIKQQEQRQALVEAAVVGLVKEDTRLDAKIDTTTTRIENKLDRVIERR